MSPLRHRIAFPSTNQHTLKPILWLQPACSSCLFQWWPLLSAVLPWAHASHRRLLCWSGVRGVPVWLGVRRDSYGTLCPSSWLWSRNGREGGILPGATRCQVPEEIHSYFGKSEQRGSFCCLLKIFFKVLPSFISSNKLFCTHSHSAEGDMSVPRLQTCPPRVFLLSLWSSQGFDIFSLLSSRQLSSSAKVALHASWLSPRRSFPLQTPFAHHLWFVACFTLIFHSFLSCFSGIPVIISVSIHYRPLLHAASCLLCQALAVLLMRPQPLPPHSVCSASRCWCPFIFVCIFLHRPVRFMNDFCGWWL